MSSGSALRDEDLVHLLRQKVQLQPGVLERRVVSLCFMAYEILKSFLFFWVIWSNFSNSIGWWMAWLNRMACSKLCAAPEVQIL